MSHGNKLFDKMGDGNKLFDMVAPDAGAPFELLAAAEAGDEPRVASLLRSQADVNARDERGWSPLIMAAKEGRTSLLRLLLAAGAAPSAPDVSHTALRGAALFGHAECIRLLVEVGAEVNQSSEGGKTPLMGAAMNGHAGALALLLRHCRCVQSRAGGAARAADGPRLKAVHPTQGQSARRLAALTLSARAWCALRAGLARVRPRLFPRAGTARRRAPRTTSERAQ
jgi:ankyrin repeat protein